MRASDNDEPEERCLRLLAYEQVAEHGFALPCFGRYIGSNAVFIARATAPGDADSAIEAFESYTTDTAVNLPAALDAPSLRIGDPWVDVFVWDAKVYVGQRLSIWQQLSPVITEIADRAPLTFLDLVEGIDAARTVSAASAALRWVERSLGAEAASHWQSGVYLFGLARRDLQRTYRRTFNGVSGFSARSVSVSVGPSNAVVSAPRRLVPSNPATVLPSFYAACEGFGLSVQIELTGGHEDDGIGRGEATLLMRLRRGRGNTQTQIPFRAIDAFFGSTKVVRSSATGLKRQMTLSRSGDSRNTMKLQLPEMAKLNDPVALFRRVGDDITYVIYDASSGEGTAIMDMLKAGIADGTTRHTAGKATWWRRIE